MYPQEVVIGLHEEIRVSEVKITSMNGTTSVPFLLTNNSKILVNRKSDSEENCIYWCCGMEKSALIW